MSLDCGGHRPLTVLSFFLLSCAPERWATRAGHWHPDINHASVKQQAVKHQTFTSSHVLLHPPQVLRIDAIPSKSLDTIKDWLNSVGIKYYESKLNLAWKPILK